jgi:hypothetical protein
MMALFFFGAGASVDSGVGAAGALDTLMLFREFGAGGSENAGGKPPVRV